MTDESLCFCRQLENTISQLQEEVKVGKEKLVSHDQAAKRTVTSLQNELKARVDQVCAHLIFTRLFYLGLFSFSQGYFSYKVINHCEIFF